MVVAGGATVLALKRTDPAPKLAQPGGPVEIPGNQISDLGARLQTPARAIEATMFDLGEKHGACRIQITGTWSSDKPLVVAIFDLPAGVRLATTVVDSLPKTLTFDHLPLGQYQISLARYLQCARLTYLQRHDLKIVENVTAEVQLTSGTDELELVLALAAPPEADNHRPSVVGIPVLLHRVDDPNWRYRRPFSPKAEVTTVRSDENGRVIFKDLGSGRYRLEMHGFEPIEAEVARLTFELGAFDSTRPIRGRAH